MWRLIALALVVGNAFGCPVDVPQLTSVPDPKTVATFQHESTGANRIEIHAGQQFAIRLRSNPTTGYQYRQAPGGLLSDPQAVSFVGCIYERTPASPKLMGSGGHETWLFQVAKDLVPGTTFDVRLIYARPWITDPTTDNTVTIFQVGVIA